MISNETLIEIATTHADFINGIHFDFSLKYEIVVHNREIKGWFAKAWGHTDLVKRRAKIGLITLNPVMKLANAGEITLVVSHEMLHVAQFIMGLKGGHGPAFKQLARQFNLPEDVGQRCMPQTVVRHPHHMRRDATALMIKPEEKK